MSRTTKPDGVKGRTRRSPRLVMLGALLVALGGLGAASLYTAVSQERPAVAMARDVMRGQSIALEDLKVANAPPGLVKYYPADHLDSLVGKRAAFDLPQDAFVAERLLGSLDLPEGNVTIGLKLAHGRMPTAQLQPGQQVGIVDVSGGSVLTSGIVVTAPIELDDRVSRTLDVSVTQGMAAQVSTLAATDQIALFATAG